MPRSCQLDGEIYADFSSVAIGAGQLFLGAVRDQRAPRPRDGPGAAMAHRVRRRGLPLRQRRQPRLQLRTAGLAGGVERRFDPALLAGIALGYANSGFNTRGISGNGIADTFAIAPYARYAPGRWYVEVAIGAAYNDASVARDIVFPGQALGDRQAPRFRIPVAARDRLSFRLGRALRS